MSLFGGIPYPNLGRKWFLTWLSSAQVEYRTLTAEDFCSKEGAVDSVDEPPAVPGVRVDATSVAGFSANQDGRSAWFRPATLP